MAVVVGDTAEVEELVGEISNPISFSNSLGLKSEVVCNCGRVEGGGSDGGAIVSFFCFLSFFFFFSSLPLLLTLFTGMVSTNFL